MRFRQFIESGHVNLLEPRSISVVYHGETVALEGIVYIDPRFEFMNVPSLNPRSNKFLGESDYSLPLADGSWIVSQRDNMMSGKGHFANEPIGVEAPQNWADYALFIGRDGSLVKPEVVQAV